MRFNGTANEKRFHFLFRKATQDIHKNWKLSGQGIFLQFNTEPSTFPIMVCVFFFQHFVLITGISSQHLMQFLLAWKSLKKKKP